jgi:hypothetical protein
MREKGLNKVQLQYLAILAMVVDHVAWGFLEFKSPVGFAMHIFGRLTIPIMTFFIAEGFAHTRDIKKYVLRMVIFALIAIIPFYLFFSEEYGYRQNIIFDELLALLSLCAMKKGNMPKPVRILIVIGLMAVSMAVGGWVLMPIIYVLVFSYNEKFKDKAKWFCFLTCILVASVATLIITNRMFHYMQYDWSMLQSVYLAGFMLGLIPLSMYNGQKGEPIFGRYFFYIFYPAHFIVLWLIKLLVG